MATKPEFDPDSINALSGRELDEVVVMMLGYAIAYDHAPGCEKLGFIRSDRIPEHHKDVGFAFKLLAQLEGYVSIFIGQLDVCVRDAETHELISVGLKTEPATVLLRAWLKRKSRS